MACRLQGVGGLLLARRSLRGLCAVDEITLSLACLREMLDGFRMSLFAGATSG
jgi:hypothetical protein